MPDQGFPQKSHTHRDSCLDGGSRATFKLDQDVRCVDSLGRVRVLQLKDLLVDIARAGSVHAHGFIGPTGTHEPARNIEVVDGCIGTKIGERGCYVIRGFTANLQCLSIEGERESWCAFEIKMRVMMRPQEGVRCAEAVMRTFLMTQRKISIQNPQKI